MVKTILMASAVILILVSINIAQFLTFQEQNDIITQQQEMLVEARSIVLEAKDLISQCEMSEEQIKLNLKIDSYTTVYDSEGRIKFYSEHPALLTNAGKELIEGVLGNQFGSEPTVDYIAVGGNTSAMAAADTTLANEFSTCGLTRAQGTYASTGTGAWRLEKDFAVTGTCNNINSTGIFNASSTGCLFAEDSISNTNVINGDTLNITWTVSVS